MKPSLREGEISPSCPPAGPVPRRATLREGVKSKRSKRSKVFVCKNWKDARDEAMQYFGVEAGDLEMSVDKEQQK